MTIKLKDRVGEKYPTNEGYSSTIIEAFTTNNCTIQLDNGLKLYKRNLYAIMDGRIKNPYHPSVHKVGYIGVGKYPVSLNRKAIPHYEYWIGMLRRCYDLDFQRKHPSYIGCSVDESWHNYQIFAEWFEQNFYFNGSVKYQLDKDILVKGSKIYSSETCGFVPQEINKLFLKRKTLRGNCPIGVHQKGKVFIAQIMIEGEKINLGRFKTKEEAFQTYKIAKESEIKRLAKKWKPFISKRLYQALINYKVEISD